jgi:hypothetical protein
MLLAKVNNNNGINFIFKLCLVNTYIPALDKNLRNDPE